MLVSNRTNTILLVLILALGVGIIAMLASRASAGPLDPPAAPGSTDGVRKAGTPIGAIPYTISTPGYYYLTRNLVAAPGNTDGIEIGASGVTLDFGGFTLNGQSSSGIGVSSTNSSFDSILVEHGHIKGFYYGIFINASRVQISDMQVLNPSALGGIVLDTYAVVDGCMVNGPINGIQVGTFGVVRNCEVSETTGHGIVAAASSVIEDNVIHNSGLSAGGYGIHITGMKVSVRNNTLENGTRDILVDANAALILDNMIHCPTSIVDGFAYSYYAPVDSEVHANVPRFSALSC